MITNIFYILTILNTLAMLYLLKTKNIKLYIKISKETTFFINTLLGYRIILWKINNEYSSSVVFNIYIPVKNKNKIELKEEIDSLLKGSYQNRRYTLNAKFSWLKTLKEVEQFKKDYFIVDSEIINNLVNNFKNNM